ncbi:MAG: NAD(P)H-dependent oxidoreductase subunit E, partial [Planctomycetota bacterium]
MASEIVLPEVEPEHIDEIVDRSGSTRRRIVAILRAVQERYGWLPPEALRRVTAITEITP